LCARIREDSKNLSGFTRAPPLQESSETPSQEPASPKEEQSSKLGLVALIFGTMACLGLMVVGKHDFFSWFYQNKNFNGRPIYQYIKDVLANLVCLNFSCSLKKRLKKRFVIELWFGNIFLEKFIKIMFLFWKKTDLSTPLPPKNPFVFCSREGKGEDICF